jgi:hypothetical protein
MAATYNGTASGITPHQAPSATLPQATDVLSEEGHNPAIRRCLDFLAYLMAKSGLIDQPNTWTLQQKMSGGGDALQLKAGPAGTDAVFLSFFPRGATPNVRGAWMGYGANGSAELWVLNEIGQAIFGNALDADVKILRNGASVISFYGNGTTDAHNRRIINLADPSFPSDAATANYAQALIA